MAYGLPASSKTFTKNKLIGIQDAINLRKRLGKETEYFDQRLLGKEVNPYFQFNPQEYDLIYGELITNGVSKLSAEIFAYEILALSKWYDEPYDKILPEVINGKLTLDNDMLKRLNYTRPSNNKLSVASNNYKNDILKELVD
tara:strand:- start:26 stop:451 length:426 start_codon:yes stop_codon:yes gene_type:complete